MEKRTIREQNGVGMMNGVQILAKHQDDVDALVDLYHGDVKSLIVALLQERELLIQQIETASNAMSYGFTRGWKAKIPDERITF